MPWNGNIIINMGKLEKQVICRYGFVKFVNRFHLFVKGIFNLRKGVTEFLS